MLTFAHSTYFHDLLNSFAAGVVICNAKGRIYASNTAASRLLGFDAAALARAATSRRILGRCADSRAVLRFLAEPLRHARKPTAITLAYSHPDGAVRHFGLSCSFLLENDKIFGIMLQIDDVTEMVRLHQRERDMLLAVQAQQRERIESLGHFSLAVAHQVRNPLMVIGGFAGRLLRAKAPDDPEAESLSMILDGAKRLEAVVRAVDAFARRREPQPTAVRPAALVVEAMHEARIRTGRTEETARLVFSDDAAVSTLQVDADLAREALLVFSDDAAVSTLQVDADLAREALVELLANALEAQTDDPARVMVTVRREAEMVRLTVADVGPGIAPDIRPYVLDPFFTTKAVGVGMGLAMAKRDASELGGDLVLENAPGGGCLATLVLPATAT